MCFRFGPVGGVLAMSSPNPKGALHIQPRGSSGARSGGRERLSLCLHVDRPALPVPVPCGSSERREGCSRESPEILFMGAPSSAREGVGLCGACSQLGGGPASRGVGVGGGGWRGTSPFPPGKEPSSLCAASPHVSLLLPRVAGGLGLRPRKEAVPLTATWADLETSR